MKKMIISALVAGCLLTACNEDSFLKEQPMDFMSSDNSYITEKDFNMAIIDLYDYVRYEFYGYNEYRPMDYIYGTDLVYDGEPGGVERHGNMNAAYQPTSHIPKTHWDNLYKLISSANVVISRVETTDLSDDLKTQFKAKASFFRGFAYRTLVYLFGGVPLVLEEISTPKTDFVRASKQESLAQAIADVSYAAEHLGDIASVKDGEISSTVAYHLLAELYLAAGEPQKAVDAATKVISNPAVALMQHRFGSRAGEVPGDVYWDLFRMNNQNRASGNTEGLWVIQYETDLPGGGSSTVTAKTTGNYCFERNFAPMVRDVRLRAGDKSYSPFRWPVSDYTGGRGIGWGVSSHYYSNEVWEDDFYNDIRNANHNFVRKFAVHNESFRQQFGIDSIDVDNPPAGLVVGQGNSTTIPGRYLYAYQSKITTPYNHPDELYANRATGDLKSSAGATYTDQYMFRLAETYLLRAEAYIALNDKAKAAADVNVVRARARAKAVQASEVSLDYILDERVRELGIEEKRRLTLMRTGKLYEYVVKHNPWYADPQTCGDGIGMLEKYNVWPIPYSAIEANTDAVLEQNPGY